MYKEYDVNRENHATATFANLFRTIFRKIGVDMMENSMPFFHIPTNADVAADCIVDVSEILVASMFKAE